MEKRDGRTREARMLRAIRAELAAHVGGHPSPTQAALIEAGAQLQLRIAMMDRKVAEGGMNDHDSRTYLAWVGALGRLMQRLDNLKGRQDRPMTAAEAMRAIHGDA